MGGAEGSLQVRRDVRQVEPHRRQDQRRGRQTGMQNKRTFEIPR